MPRFRYEALTVTGATRSGAIDASSPQEAIALLRKMDLFPTRIVEEGEEAERRAFRIPFITGRVRASEVEFFSYQMATMLNAGVPLTEALGIVIGQVGNKSFRRVISQVREDVEHGATLADAMSRHPRVFSELYVNMIRAGEMGGILGSVFERLASFSERQRLLKSAVISAMFYPAILFTMSLVILVVLTVFVIPKFTAMFAEMKITLPLPTRILIGFTGGVREWWWLILIGLITTIFAVRQYARTESGRIALDRLRIRMPLIGSIFRAFALARFTRTMGTLLENGVILLDALTVVKDTIGNKIYEKAIEQSIEEIKHGSTLARQMSEQGIFPEMVVNMISIGEESGRPEVMFNKLADFYDLETRKYLDRVTSTIGPLVVLLMGGMVAFMAVAMVLPIFEASTALGG
ncbi:TPA: type II secretion system F family protein [Candidatus Poribacteria bacterium]|nr:type II secretion system F family protein [Candidatus Poribacteria bacterium]